MERNNASSYPPFIINFEYSEYFISILDFLNPLRKLTEDIYLKYIELVFDVPSLPHIITSGFGTITNIINILVFYRQGVLSDSCTPSLMAIAVSDFLQSLLVFVSGVSARIIASIDTVDSGMFLYRFMGIALTTDSTLRFYIEPIVVILSKPILVTTEFSCWATVYLAFERMVSVTFPFLVKGLLTPKRSCAVIICLFVMSVIFALPLLINLILVSVNVPGKKESVLNIRMSNVIPFDIYNTINIVHQIGGRVTSIILIIVFNVIIMVKVNISHEFRKSNASTGHGTTSHITASDSPPKHEVLDVEKKKKTTTNAETSKELKLIRMIIVVSITFFICRIPNAIYTLLYGPLSLMTDYFEFIVLFKRTEYFYQTMVDFGTYMLTLNSATNIIIYYVMSAKYRKGMLAVIRPCKLS